MTLEKINLDSRYVLLTLLLAVALTGLFGSQTFSSVSPSGRRCYHQDISSPDVGKIVLPCTGGFAGGGERLKQMYQNNEYFYISENAIDDLPTQLYENLNASGVKFKVERDENIIRGIKSGWKGSCRVEWEGKDDDSHVKVTVNGVLDRGNVLGCKLQNVENIKCVDSCSGQTARQALDSGPDAISVQVFYNVENTETSEKQETNDDDSKTSPTNSPEIQSLTFFQKIILKLENILGVDL